VAAQVDDPLAPLALDVALVYVSERAEKAPVELQAALQGADHEVEVVDGVHSTRRLGGLASSPSA